MMHFQRTPGQTRPLPAGRHGFASGLRQFSQGKTKDEAACGFSRVGWRAKV